MPEVSDILIELVVAMTRAARRETHPDPESLRQRRDRLLARHGFVARVREDDQGPTMVCYPAEWVKDGVFQPDQLDSTDNAIERPLFSAASGDGWAGIDAHNQQLADAVADAYGQIHGENASAFGTYLANHHKARVEVATEEQVEAFRDEYFPRNAWPTDEQATVLDTSLELLFEVAGVPDPPIERS